MGRAVTKYWKILTISLLTYFIKSCIKFIYTGKADNYRGIMEPSDIFRSSKPEEKDKIVQTVRKTKYEIKKDFRQIRTSSLEELDESVEYMPYASLPNTPVKRGRIKNQTISYCNTPQPSSSNGRRGFSLNKSIYARESSIGDPGEASTMMDINEHSMILRQSDILSYRFRSQDIIESMKTTPRQDDSLIVNGHHRPGSQDSTIIQPNSGLTSPWGSMSFINEESKNSATTKRKKDESSIVFIERPSKNAPKIFKRKHVIDVVEKIKAQMNHTDNKVANDILAKFKHNRELGRQCVVNVGAASANYVKPFPKYSGVYAKKIEDTVEALTVKLKRDMDARKITNYLKGKTETKVREKRPLLYSFGFNMNDFVKERKLNSITQFIKETDTIFWEVLNKNPDELKRYIRYAGDDHVRQIFKIIEAPPLNRDDRYVRPARHNHMNTFLTNIHPCTPSPAGKKAKPSEFGYQEVDETKSNFLYHNTKTILQNMKEQTDKIKAKILYMRPRTALPKEVSPKKNA